MTFMEWVEKWRVGPGMNDAPDTERYSGADGVVGDGWVDILDRLARDLVALGWDRRVFQIKEKFGALRFYIGGAHKSLHDRVTVAEIESASTCEVCGAAGACLRMRGWLKTLCDKCVS